MFNLYTKEKLDKNTPNIEMQKFWNSINNTKITSENTNKPDENVKSTEIAINLEVKKYIYGI